MRIKIEDFCEFIEKELSKKYEKGMSGLKDRFQTLIVIFKDIMSFTIELN